MAYHLAQVDPFEGSSQYQVGIHPWYSAELASNPIGLVKGLIP